MISAKILSFLLPETTSLRIQHTPQSLGWSLLILNSKLSYQARWRYGGKLERALVVEGDALLLVSFALLPSHSRTIPDFLPLIPDAFPISNQIWIEMHAQPDFYFASCRRMYEKFWHPQDSFQIHSSILIPHPIHHHHAPPIAFLEALLWMEEEAGDLLILTTTSLLLSLCSHCLQQAYHSSNKLSWRHTFQHGILSIIIEWCCWRCNSNNHTSIPLRSAEHSSTTNRLAGGATFVTSNTGICVCVCS